MGLVLAEETVWPAMKCACLVAKKSSQNASSVEKRTRCQVNAVGSSRAGVLSHVLIDPCSWNLNHEQTMANNNADCLIFPRTGHFDATEVSP